MTKHLIDALLAGAADFEKKFGRPPREGDPILFDPDSDIPVPIPAQKMADQMTVAMVEAGIPERLIWIWIRTSLIPTDDNQRIMSREDRRAWKRASREYECKRPDLTGEVEAARERLARNQYPARESPQNSPQAG
jgi:hypothetical protein